MRWTGHDPTNDVAAFLGLNTATAVGTTSDAATATTAIGALKNYAIGAQNFVLADDGGHIGYYPHARVPLRPWAGQIDPVAHVPLNPWIPLPGYGSAEWGPGPGTNCAGTGASAPGAACFTADADLPQAVDPAKGYLATANSDPKGYGNTNDPINGPVAGGKYLSFDWDDPTAVRYARIADLLKKKTTGGNKVAVTDMQAIQSDHVMLVAKLFRQYLPPKNAVTGSNGVAYGAAVDMLAQWATDGYDCPTGLSGTSPSSAQDSNFTHVFDSSACLLFHYYLKTLLANVFNDDFAYVKAATGQDPNGDGGRQIRAVLYMLGLEAASVVGGGSPTPPGTEYCSKLTFTGSGSSISGTVTTVDCFTQEVTALVTAWLTINADAGPPPTQASPTTRWLWGKYHTLTTTSPAAPLISVGFEAGPFARPGGALTVDVGNPDPSQSTPLGMTYSHGSNVRFIGAMDPSTSAQPLMQLPGVEHDAPYAVFSSTPDLLSAYVQNLYFTYLMSHQVDANAVSTQGFAAP
jgi:penicillin amidase